MLLKENKKKEALALKKMVRLTDYLSVAQIFLRDNYFLERELRSEDIKKRLLGHWGTCPGINFIYANINRMIVKDKRGENDFIFTVGPGHGFPAFQANLFLDGSLSENLPDKIPFNKKGLEEILENFSTPYGYPSHLNPEAPGVLLEGGELGYSLSVAAGSVLNNPRLINICLIGDGEAETGALSASWHINKYLSPKKDGVVLPILHLNGYKISGPTIFGRMSDIEIKKYFKSLGYKPYIIDAYKKKDFYIKGIEVFDDVFRKIKRIKEKAERGEKIHRPVWPIIILKTPKGMGAPKSVDGNKVSGNYLSHQVIFEDVAENKEHLKILEQWLKGYKVDELISFNEKGGIELDQDIKDFLPDKCRALGNFDVLNGHYFDKFDLPDIDDYFVEQERGVACKNVKKENSMYLAGTYLREVMKKNDIMIFSPDETYSNRLQAVFEVTKRQWQFPIKKQDLDFGSEGKVIEILSEHVLFGMLWGYTLMGRAGFFTTYEAFAPIISSMLDQYVKFLNASRKAKFRGDIPSLNIILSSLLERQDHNGYSHQNPSLISNNLDRDLDLINIYFPADKNMMIHALEKSLNKKNNVNIIVAGKKITRTWLNKDEAEELSKKGIGIFNFISDEDPDIVLVTAGDYVTEESVIGLKLFKERYPNIKVRFVNIFQLDILGGKDGGYAKEEIIDKYFTKDKGIIFNYHGYPASIKKLLFDYNLSDRIIINGYLEKGSTTSPFDMKARNGLSRFHLFKDLAGMALREGLIDEKEFNEVNKEMDSLFEEEKKYIIKNKVDPDFIKNWKI